MKLPERAIVSPEVLTRVLGDETVILDLATGTYFGLDPVGSRVWELIGEGSALSEICERLQQEYDVPMDILESDVLNLIHDLKLQNLISVITDDES